MLEKFDRYGLYDNLRLIIRPFIIGYPTILTSPIKYNMILAHTHIVFCSPQSIYSYIKCTCIGKSFDVKCLLSLSIFKLILTMP